MPARRLVIRPGAIGDFILALPAMECLRADFLEVWTASRNLPLARFADRSRSIAVTGIELLEIAGAEDRTLRDLASFDSIVSWYGSNRPAFRSAVRDLGLPFHFLAALPPEGSRIHAVDFYLEQAHQFEACRSDGIPRIPCPRNGGGFVAIQPFSGGKRKNWPLERFQELARRIERTIPVRWCAGPEEEYPGAVRFDDLYDLACWLSSARLYIGNDSGITHLAAAAGVPVVALFGPTDPAIWAPRGPHVHVVATETPGQPIDVLTIESVESVVYHTLGVSN